MVRAIQGDSLKFKEQMSRGLDLPGEATPCKSVLRRCRSEMRFINWPSSHSIFVCILQAFEREHIERTISELVFQLATRVSGYFKEKNDLAPGSEL